MWWVETAAFSYAALCCLARANHRYRAVPLGGWVVTRGAPARIAGWSLLAGAVAVAVAALGLAQGLVALACLFSVVGLAFVLLLSVRPRLALAPAILLPGTRLRRR